jgi:hypothetical protein
VEVVYLGKFAQPAAPRGRLKRWGGHVNGQAEYALKNAQPAGVVAMVVGNDYGIDLGDVALVFGQPLSGGLGADAGVEQQPGAAGLDVNTIAIAAGLERDDLHTRIRALDGRIVNGIALAARRLGDHERRIHRFNPLELR